MRRDSDRRAGIIPQTVAVEKRDAIPPVPWGSPEVIENIHGGDGGKKDLLVSCPFVVYVEEEYLLSVELYLNPWNTGCR
jgi:hypothetical protein